MSMAAACLHVVLPAWAGLDAAERALYEAMAEYDEAFARTRPGHGGEMLDLDAAREVRFGFGGVGPGACGGGWAVHILAAPSLLRRVRIRLARAQPELSDWIAHARIEAGAEWRRRLRAERDARRAGSDGTAR